MYIRSWCKKIIFVQEHPDKIKALSKVEKFICTCRSWILSLYDLLWYMVKVWFLHVSIYCLLWMLKSCLCGFWFCSLPVLSKILNGRDGCLCECECVIKLIAFFKDIISLPKPQLPIDFFFVFSPPPLPRSFHLYFRAMQCDIVTL